MEDDVEAIVIKGQHLNVFGKTYLSCHPLISEQAQFTPQWILCNRKHVEYELYWQGCILSCSKGTHQHKMLVKTLTIDQPIQQALITNLNNEQSVSEDFIVILSEINVHFFSFDGQDISRALPFQGAAVWPMNPGLLIHKKQGSKLEAVNCSTVTLLSPLDEFSYIQLEGGPRDNLTRDSTLDSSHFIVTVLCNQDSRHIVTCYKSTLNIWEVTKCDRDHLTSYTSQCPLDEVEGLKSRLGGSVFTPNLRRSNSIKVVDKSKQQVHRERTPSTNASSFLHTLPNMTTATESIVNNTLLSTTRYSVLCTPPGFYIKKIYSVNFTGSHKHLKVVKYRCYSGKMYLAVLNQQSSTMEVFSLTKDQIEGPIITVPCIDFGFIPTSKFLVVIHPAGLVYLYDGITQVVRLILHDKEETINKPHTKKQRINSGEMCAAHISFTLNEAFVLGEENESVYYCKVPEIANTKIIRKVLDSVMLIMNTDKDDFYRILVRHSLSDDKLDTWEILLSLILEFIELKTVPVSCTVTSRDPAVRRTRHSQTNEDWEFMLNEMLSEVSESSFGLPPLKNLSLKDTSTTSAKLNQDRTEKMLGILHTVHTELALDLHSKKITYDLATLVYHIAQAGAYPKYAKFYKSLYPNFPALQTKYTEGEEELVPLHATLASLLSGNTPRLPDLIPGVSVLTESVLILYLMITNHTLDRKSLRYVTSSSDAIARVKSGLAERGFTATQDRLLLAMVILGLNKRSLGSLPPGIRVPLLDTLYPAHKNPPPHLSPSAYSLIHRNDVIKTLPEAFMSCREVKTEEKGANTEMSYTSPVLDFRFPEDKRVLEASRMFSTTKPVKIVVEKKSDMTDTEHTDQQELLLFNKTKRTMAAPVGKALFSFGTLKPSPRDPITIPDVCISGKALPRGNTVTLDLDAEMIHWSEFHSGVATGLRIDPLLSDIDCQWIVYNRPQDLSNKHAGFLFALGLTGHLKKLSSRNLHDYLCQRHKFTSIGLLLGLGVTNRGTQDETITKLFSIHIPALLPPTAVPLELDHLVQTAAIAGLGLVYIGSAHRRMAEILLEEIGRAPGPEMDNCEDREGYSLACGFSLGVVLLGMGNQNLPGLDDLKLTDRLYKYMNGGKKEEGNPAVPPSFRIWEGNMINTNVSSGGATIALGLTFLKTGNKNIARTLSAPHTEYLLEGVRPDMLLVRTLCYGLIMWEDILPTAHWINSQIPEVLLDCLEVLTGVSDDSTGISMKVDPETAFPCTLTILAGGCFALALRFAGTGNKAAFDTIMFYLNTTHHISRHPRDYAGFSKDLTEMCLVCLLVSASLVMAGTGNLTIMRLIRRLRKRVGPVNTYGHNYVTYGCHMGIHMSLGLLFLGGGRYTLKRDNESLAAMLLSFYPIFQTSQDDNTYHLQAFRHLWVIAAQPRLLVTVDEDTNSACYVPVTITTTPDCVPRDHSTSDDVTRPRGDDVTRTVFTPVLLPELQTIKQLSVIGERYWPINITDLDQLARGFIYVKKRTGYLEYQDDPEGKINLLGRTFGDKITSTILETIKTFSHDEKIVQFTKKFCPDNPKKCDVITNRVGSQNEDSGTEWCKEQLLSCLLEERAQYLALYTTLYKTLTTLATSPTIENVNDVKLILTFYENSRNKNLITSKILSRLSYRLEGLLSESGTDEEAVLCEPKLSDVTLQSIVSEGHDEVCEALMATQPKDTVVKFMELLTLAGV